MDALDTNTTLKDALSAAIPVGCNVSVRYLHSISRKCEPLFSPLPHGRPERTRLTSHFLTVAYQDNTVGHVLVYAVEVLIYNTTRLTTLFISKADSTGYIPRESASPIKAISTTFLKWLSDRERAKAPQRKQVISLFGRAQGQYLFPGSAENAKKHVLDDRQLIKWWVRVLDPLFALTNERGPRGYITVPGYRAVELRQFLPSARDHWTAGQPLREIARTRRIPEHAPTRCLLPRFPDDPKARFMQDLDDEVGLNEDAGASAVTSPSKRKNGRWKAIHDLDRFWEAMEFRQECSSGRLVGFLWVVTGEDDTTLNDSQMSIDSMASTGQNVNDDAEGAFQQGRRPPQSAKKNKIKTRLKGPIHSRKARIKGSSNKDSKASVNHFDGNGLCLTADGYDQAMQTLLHLDFASIAVAVKSTWKWIDEIASLSHQPKHSWTLAVNGSNVGTSPSASRPAAASQINDLGGMIKNKKRPIEEVNQQPASANGTTFQPDVNVLGNGLIRKKPKVNA